MSVRISQPMGCDQKALPWYPERELEGRGGGGLKQRGLAGVVGGVGVVGGGGGFGRCLCLHHFYLFYIYKHNGEETGYHAS